MNIEPQVNPKEVRAICKEYEFNEEEAIFEEDKRVYAIKKALSKLEKGDYVIFCLYMELQSKRKVAKQLGVSYSTMKKTIRRIKNDITRLMLEDDGYDNI